MSHRFSFGNMDEDEPETVRKIEQQQSTRMTNNFREPIITPLPKKKWFWQRWYDYVRRGFRRDKQVYQESSF